MAKLNYLELIHQEIDGANSPKESAELGRYLAENPERQNLYNDFLAMSKALQEFEELEPSPNLKKRILNAIQTDKYAIKSPSSAVQTPGFLQSLASAISAKANLKYAYAFSLGVLGGMLVYSLLIEGIQKNVSFDNSDLYGTLRQRMASHSFETADFLEINLNEVRGTVKSKVSSSLVVAELHFATPKEIDLVLDFDENDLGFNSFMKLKSNASHPMSVHENSLKLVHLGDNQYVVAFTNKTEAATPMRIKIFSEGVLLHEQTILTSSESR